jgi:hypothetical protein
MAVIGIAVLLAILHVVVRNTIFTELACKARCSSIKLSHLLEHLHLLDHRLRPVRKVGAHRVEKLPLEVRDCALAFCQATECKLRLSNQRQSKLFVRNQLWIKPKI